MTVSLAPNSELLEQLVGDSVTAISDFYVSIIQSSGESKTLIRYTVLTETKSCGQSLTNRPAIDGNKRIHNNLCQV